MKECKNGPCRECPYKKTAAPGYFGGNTFQTYLEGIIYDRPTPCHMTSGDNEKQCAGAILLRINTAKRSIDPELLTQENKLRSSEKARSLVFDNTHDFYVHHH